MTCGTHTFKKNGQRRLLGIACLLMAIGMVRAGQMSVRADAISATRLARLSHGVNMSVWFRGGYKQSYGEEDMKLLRSIGVHHLRLPVSADLLFDETSPDRLDTANLKRLDQIIALASKEKLGIVVALFDVSPRLWTSPAFATKFATFWQTLAAHLSATDPDYVFLETANEPAVETAEKWNPIQADMLAAMRKGAPRHTLIADANLRVVEQEWTQVGALEKIVPVSDPNIVYNFHFYEPVAFTRQGETAGWEKLRHFHDVPFPSSPAAVAPVLPKIDADGRSEVEFYGSNNWDAAKVEGLIKRTADWAAAYKVHLTCNEFGVRRPVAPPSDRLTWLSLTRTLLEKYGIGWAVWDYDGDFGLALEKDGKRAIDAQTARALGFQVESGVQHFASVQKPNENLPIVDPIKKGYALSWSDEFNGSKLDTTKWIDSYPDNNRTHSNGEQQYYATDGYAVSDGVLKLKAQKRTMGGMPYTSGMIASYGKFAQKYGWFEIRMKFPKGKGMWPAFWLLPETKAWPPEIDILEILGHEPNKVYLTNHWKPVDGVHDGKGDSYTGPDFSADFHTFALEWTPTELVWYVDSKERYRTDRHIPQEPMYVIANLAVGGDWPGLPDAATVFPASMDIDYIRVYQKRTSANAAGSPRR